MLQMSELRTKWQFLHAKFTQLRSLPNEMNTLFSALLELYVQTQLKRVVILCLRRTNP